jgi:hypothetical protein
MRCPPLFTSNLSKAFFLPSSRELSFFQALESYPKSFSCPLWPHSRSIFHWCCIVASWKRINNNNAHDAVIFLVCMRENTNTCDVLGCVREETNVLHQHDGTLMHICVGRHQRSAWSSCDPLYFRPSQNLLCVALFPKLPPPNPFAIMIPFSKHLLWSSKT